MKSPHYFIVKPLNSERYSNLSESGLVLNISYEDHTFTQRLAEVISTPIGYQGDVNPGDIIVVHHNTFRVQYNNQGFPLESKYHIKDDLFYVETPLTYMVIKKDTNEVKAIAPYCFIQPMFEKDEFGTGEKEVEQMCWLKYKNDQMKSFNEGDVIGVKKDSEYEFNLFGEKLYMINSNRILFSI